MIPDHLKSALKFQYIPDYANFLLNNKLEEFVLVGIRFCREVDLPMMRPLSKLSEKDLVTMSMDTNKELLEALAHNKVVTLVEKNLLSYKNNQIVDKKGQKILDRSEVLAEDIILGTRVKRKMFNFFLQSYTQNAVVHTLIMDEMDHYTTHEQLLTSKVLIDLSRGQA
ncbi:MAG: hypothetical protein K0R26_2046 [Bacteroidota bacterium]|jgi:hypothetical protein|nr:hypothetical protein [Bacteroidota bacterium]